MLERYDPHRPEATHRAADGSGLPVIGDDRVHPPKTRKHPPHPPRPHPWLRRVILWVALLLALTLLLISIATPVDGATILVDRPTPGVCRCGLRPPLTQEEP